MSRFFPGSARSAQEARNAARKEKGTAGAESTPSPRSDKGFGGAGAPPGGGGSLPGGEKPPWSVADNDIAPGTPPPGGAPAQNAEKARPPLKLSPTPPHPAFWQEVGSTISRSLGLNPNFSLVGQWVLVLSALNIPHRLIRQNENFYLYVPVMYAQQAENELEAYLLEDLNKPKPRPLPKYENNQVSLAVLLCLAVFFGLYTGWFKWRPMTPEIWVNLGGLDAGRVLIDHEWYRTVTALTLHADSGHLFANLFFGGLVAVLLCSQVGAGLGWLLILLSGVFGNALITALRGGPHVSIGASTALLGAMGVLCGFTVFSTDDKGWRRIVLPFAAALAWLAFLGSEGEKTDLGAHFTGMFCGLPLGLGAGLLFKRKLHPSPRADRYLGFFALLILAFAWFMAFAKGS